MKTPSKPFPAKGFTLVELLVVIAIIAVLAAAGFAVGPAMMNRAKKVSAQATATSVANAVESFYTEYSALPDPTGNSSTDTEFSTTEASGVKLLEILSAKDNGDQNPRKIRFFSAKDAKNGRDGVIYQGDAIKSLVDPWAQPFYIRIDYDYDERVVVDPAGSAPSATLNGRRVAVYSLGVQKPADANAKTIVKTW